MKFKVKFVAFALVSGAVALQSASCVFRFLGDLLGDYLAFVNNPL